jgi:hypothetical protein
VKLDNFNRPGPLVKIVHILCYDTFYDPEMFHFGKSEMSGVWFRRSEVKVAGLFQAEVQLPKTFWILQKTINGKFSGINPRP